MSELLRVPVALFVATSLLVATGGYGQADEAENGDIVVLYTAKFNAEDFDRAKQIMVEGFTNAMSAGGQPWRTYWIANPETHEIVSISFFQDGDGADEWHESDARSEVLKQLAPLRSEPHIQQHYEVIGSHDTRD